MIKYSTFLQRVLTKVESDDKIHPLYWGNIVIGESRFKKACIAHHLKYVEDLGVMGPCGTQYQILWMVNGQYNMTAQNIIDPRAIHAAHCAYLRDQIKFAKEQEKCTTK